MSGSLLLAGCCCDPCPDDEPCTYCMGGTHFATWGGIVISGDVTIADFGLEFQYDSTDGGCDCWWTWSATIDGNFVELIVYYTDDYWCAIFRYGSNTYVTTTDCPCDALEGAGVIPDLCCIDGNIHGEFTLPKSGGGDPVTITMGDEIIAP